MVVLETVADLAWAADLAALELHVPQWQIAGTLEPTLPDLLVLDLDPGPDTGIRECCRLAERLRPILEADGLGPLAKTSGKACRSDATISGMTSSRPATRPRPTPNASSASRPTAPCPG